MRATFKIWTDAKSKVAAERVFERAIQQLGRVPQSHRVEPYPKTGGYVWQGELEIECTSWENCVVEIIGLGQQLCYAWTLSGDIQQEVSGWSSQARVVGVKAAEWTLQRHAQI